MKSLLFRRGFSVADHYLKNAYKGWEGVAPEKNFQVSVKSIIGDLPNDLKGTYIRNGPGLVQKYGQEFAHAIDGDGIVCSLTFPGDGTVGFRSRFVETDKRMEEEAAKKYIYRGQMGTISEEQKREDSKKVKEGIATGKLPKFRFRNPSNTNVWHWNDRFITAYETSIPYALNPLNLNTMGKETFNNTLKLNRLGAHFRIDTFDKKNHRLVTGAFSRNPAAPYGKLEINEYNKDSTLHKGQVFKVDGLTYFHDLALLKDYYVIHNSPYVVMDFKEAAKILSGEFKPTDMMKYSKNLPSEFIFLPRNKTGRELRVATPFPFHMYHFGTCSTNGDHVVLTATCLSGAFDMSWEYKYWLSNMCKAPGKFYRFDINLNKESVVAEELDPASNEFPTSHPYRHGHIGTKYNYLMACDIEGRGLPFMDIVKVDAERGAGARKVWRADGLISELVFAPRGGLASCSELDEDDGWLVTQFYNPDIPDETQFLVLSAQDIEAGPVCRIKLDFKMHYPFHGTFTPSVFE